MGWSDCTIVQSIYTRMQKFYKYIVLIFRRLGHAIEKKEKYI